MSQFLALSLPLQVGTTGKGGRRRSREYHVNLLNVFVSSSLIVSLATPCVATAQGYQRHNPSTRVVGKGRCQVGKESDPLLGSFSTVALVNRCVRKGLSFNYIYRTVSGGHSSLSMMLPE